ncbi:subunit Rieske-2 of cytochrome b-c1 complex [Chloropicon primus]|uniref:quinol--cytochrome-c reductase n=1 Tax=Chloropicon primus TaxID=1764295 RepID=A0A5B8MXM3_9CHLO|nr:subunit Rieske-2 of cytochrome b-c1 complex [Chloropicon primus]|eukprot:QDZ25349.1 subunit Rieske-2 of cytochrome b-c1 complex [Chloropicon primus]
MLSALRQTRKATLQSLLRLRACAVGGTRDVTVTAHQVHSHVVVQDCDSSSCLGLDLGSSSWGRGFGFSFSGFSGQQRMKSSLPMTGTPSTDDMVSYANESGVSPTNFALKHPTERISYDNSGGHERLAGDPSKRAFTYLVLTGGRFIYAAGLRLLVLKFILSMQASKDVLALASLEVDLGGIEEGSTVTMKWRGKPVFIKHRTADEIAEADNVNIGELRDAEADDDRCLEKKWLVLIGVCTHLGCVPLSDAGDFGGWFCPCHGSHYDVSGRIRKGPAPLNMEVPEYKFLEEDKLLIG